MSGRLETHQLTGPQTAWRFGILGALGLAMLALRAVDPTTLSWLPLRPSCGAVTGLPCIFCGTTRAFHHLLNGDLAGALYFNWLVFPLAILAGGIAAMVAAEVGMRRRLLPPLPTVRMTPRLALSGMSLLLALWILQVSLALAFHKRELLNPDGPLYRLLVRQG